jgi:metal-responsive CopG/Arc/MetJ family transcriptional regulator
MCVSRTKVTHAIASEYNCGYTQVVKTAISLADGLFEAAERLAKRLGISRSELYQRAIRAFLEKNGQEAVTAQLDEIYSAQPDASRLDEALERVQRISLPQDDW